MTFNITAYYYDHHCRQKHEPFLAAVVVLRRAIRRLVRPTEIPAKNNP